MGGILLKGLGAPACCGLILAQFNLAKCCQYTVTVTSPIQYDGGSRPLAPGEIHQFYTPVSPTGRVTPGIKPLEYLTPYNPPRPVDKIVVELKVKDKDPIVKEYYVPQYHSKVILQVTRFTAGTAGIISVSVTNLKNEFKKKIQVFIDKFTKR
jgi:hypothetical protein